MPKLKSHSATVLAILAVAQSRRYGSIMPLPEGCDIAETKTKKLINRLLGAKLVEERATASQANAWRTDDAGHYYGLRITAAGRSALRGPFKTFDTKPLDR
jgi:hypothetical protein